MHAWLKSLWMRGGKSSERVWKSGRDHYSVILASKERFEVDVYETEAGGSITCTIVLSGASSPTGDRAKAPDLLEMRDALRRYFAERHRVVSFI